MTKLQELFIAATLLLSIAAMPFAAEAQEDKQKAKTAFSEGKELFAAEKYIEAADAFRRAMAFSPSWKLYFNIAQSEAAAKRYGLALEAFEMYLSQGGDELDSQRENEIIKEIENLKTKVGLLKISAPAGAEVFIDDMRIGMAPLPGEIPISSGPLHHLVVRLGEKTLLDQQIKVWSRERQEIVVTDTAEEASSTSLLAPADTAEKPEETTPALPKENSEPSVDRGRPLRISGWVLAGTGAATLISAIIAGSVASAKENSLSKRCPDQTCTNPDDAAEIDRITGLASTSTALYIAGGVLAATGVVLVVIGAKKNRSETAGLTVTPVLTANSGGLFLKGGF